MITINFNQLYLIKKYSFDAEILKKDISKIYDIALRELNLDDNFSVNISFVGEKTIRALNKKHRNVDKVTDVLSFPLIYDYQNIVAEKDENGIIDLGDIVINLKRAKLQSAEYGHSLKREVCFLCVHGLLHLFGYDHIKKEDEIVMFSLQEKILNIANIRR